jgi:DNA topoisomerase IB
MARLRRVDCSESGYRRRRHGRGFAYLDHGGERIDDAEALERIRALAIPPAWQDVWICPLPNGHIQATGVDAAGRKQYRYHDDWRVRRDADKFDSMVRFAERLPTVREQIELDLQRDGMPRERALACAVRLLDRGSFRIGSEDYAEANETYGLATLRKEHVSVREDVVAFDYPAKSGQRRRQRVIDEQAAEAVALLLRRRGGGDELLAYKEGRRWRDVRSPDINGYLKQHGGGDFSAKDFRTWNATVLAAIALAVSGPVAGASKTARKRAVRRVVEEVAHHLGNTPAVCRASYIDPRVFDRFDGGLTIGGVLPALAADAEGWPAVQRTVEQAVLDLIAADESSEAIERAA